MDPRNGKTDPPFGLSGQRKQGVVANGAGRVAAGRLLERINLRKERKQEITMPAGVWSGSAAADPRTHSVCVGNSRYPPPEQ
jgi:hypothetical protein